MVRKGGSIAPGMQVANILAQVGFCYSFSDMPGIAGAVTATVGTEKPNLGVMSVC